LTSVELLIIRFIWGYRRRRRGQKRVVEGRQVRREWSGWERQEEANGRGPPENTDIIMSLFFFS